MWQALDNWEKYLHDESPRLPLLVRRALLHYQFETIHPFLDGNGRLGRLFIVLYLMDRSRLPAPCCTCPDTSTSARATTMTACSPSANEARSPNGFCSSLTASRCRQPMPSTAPSNCQICAKSTGHVCAEPVAGHLKSSTCCSPVPSSPCATSRSNSESASPVPPTSSGA